jgi:hypothetical protein
MASKIISDGSRPVAIAGFRMLDLDRSCTTQDETRAVT